MKRTSSNHCSGHTWRHRSGKAIEKQLRPKSIAHTGNFLAWLQDGMTDDVRTYLSSTIPAPVTFLVSRLAGRTYNRDIAPVWQA